jgi:hypothetical protein
MARVGGDGDRYAVWGLLGKGLESVLPMRRGPGVLERMDVEVVQVLVLHHDARRRLADHPGLLQERAVLAGFNDRVEHEAGLLLQR